MELPIKVYARVRRDKNGELYSLLYNEEPKNLFNNETSIYLGEIRTDDNYNRISFLNGRASIDQLKNIFKDI